MKKIHTLAATLSLAFVAGNAAASLNNGDGDGTTIGTPGSVVFAIDDTASHKTFVLDLGLKFSGLDYASFVNKSNCTNATLTWNLANDASTASIFGGANGISGDTASFKWSVLGAYGLGPNAENLNGTGGLTQWGALTTAASQSALAPATGFGTLQTEASGTGAVGGWIGGLLDPTAAGNNNVALIAATGPTSSWYGDHLGATGLGGIGASPSISGITAADLFWITNPDFAQSVDTIAKLGTFSLNGSNVLTWTAANAPAAVPLPAAVWLFGSALMGWLRLARRESALVAA
jgi:hypothetical protein